MGPEIVFVPSAFKHRFSEENIRWVLLNHLVDGLIEEDDETKYVSIGFDKSGKLLEVMYNYIDGNTGEIMADMTNEEYDALDELWTKTTPKVNFSRPGIFARQRALLEVLDKASVSYIMTRAEATNQTPAQILSKIVHQEIAAGI